MAGRVLRSSNGRFNGSTKGFRAGRSRTTAPARRQMSRKTKKRLIGLGVVAAGVGAAIYVKKNSFSRAVGLSMKDGGMVRGLRLGKATASMITTTKRMPTGWPVYSDTKIWHLKTRSFGLGVRDKKGNFKKIAGFKMEKVLRPKGVKSRGHWRVVG